MTINVSPSGISSSIREFAYLNNIKLIYFIKIALLRFHQEQQDPSCHRQRLGAL